MRVAFTDTHKFEEEQFRKTNSDFHQQLVFFDFRLTPKTAASLEGFDAVCTFVNDDLGAETLKNLKNQGVRLIALRSAGFNHVDLTAAARLGLTVTRVPSYSPHAVAEHAVCLLLALNRKIHRAYARVRELNFSLEGLVGFDLYGKTVGIIGTGKIGMVAARIFRGFGSNVLCYDINPDKAMIDAIGAKYVDLPTLYRESDVITLHVPLVPQTRHLIDESALSQMKHGVYLINTGRGGLVDTKALIRRLKAGQIGGAGLDVYEEEESVFFQDLSSSGLADDCLARLLTFPNVLITSHQAFLTREALENIAKTTLQNISDFESGRPLRNTVGPEKMA